MRALLRGLILWAMLAAAAFAQVAVPPLVARVTDTAGLLTAAQRDALEAKLATFEREHGSQLAVLIVSSVKPETIEQFGIRVAEAWKIGRKGVDDGVILVVAKDDRALRIEVGYGLEGAIPDAVANRVVDEIIAPRFRENDYAGGIDAGVTQLMKLVAGEKLPEPKRHQSSSNDMAVLPLIVGGMVAGWLLSLRIGRPAAGLVAGAGSALVGGLIAGFSLMLIFVALFVFFGVAGRGNGGGWSSGGGLGGGFGGSGGGFSGGGFGGGGASGRW